MTSLTMMGLCLGHLVRALFHFTLENPLVVSVSQSVKLVKSQKYFPKLVESQKYFSKLVESQKYFPKLVESQKYFPAQNFHSFKLIF